MSEWVEDGDGWRWEGAQDAHEVLDELTDDDWRTAHLRLAGEVGAPPGFEYVWLPGVPADQAPYLPRAVDEAPLIYDYDPGADGRFQGGGFRA